MQAAGMKKDEPDLLDLLRDHELALMRLYETFSDIFSRHQDMWKGLRKDEQKHALWIEKLRSYPLIDKWMMENVKVKLQAIKSSIGYVESRIKDAQRGNLTDLQALSIAADLESSLIEKQLSRLNNSSSEKINSIMTALAKETEQHRKKIVEAINSEKRRGS